MKGKKKMKYIKSKQERMQRNAFCVYTTSYITSSMDKLQFGVAKPLCSKKSFSATKTACFRDR